METNSHRLSEDNGSLPALDDSDMKGTSSFNGIELTGVHYLLGYANVR